MSWETKTETLTCGTLGSSQASAAEAASNPLGTVTIPANTTWEVTLIQSRSWVGGGLGRLVLRDSATTTNIYATIVVPALGQVSKSNNGSPIASTIGPFTEDVTLELILFSIGGGFSLAINSGIARLTQSYD